MADAEIDIEDSDEEVEQTKAPQKTEAQRIREERLRKLQDLQLRKVGPGLMFIEHTGLRHVAVLSCSAEGAVFS